MQSNPLAIHLQGQELLLLPEKAVFWSSQKMLIIADVHFGKVGHFRKAGIGIPRRMDQDDLALMSDLINEFMPDTILFLGDLFHSEMNSDWDWLVLWRSLHQNLRIVLVRGNHDILHDRFYLDLGFELVNEFIQAPFYFSHEPVKSRVLAGIPEYVLCGHIHPGVTLRGAGRQILTLPCFHFGTRQGILPAFGKFTGRVSMRNSRSDQVYAVLKDKVIPLQTNSGQKL